MNQEDVKSQMENKKTIELVNKVKTQTFNYRKSFEQAWKDEENAYYGLIWQGKAKTSNRPYENFIYPTVQAEVALLTDGYPSAIITSSNAEKADTIAVINKGIELIQKDQDYSTKLQLAILKSSISAPAFIHAYYDANANNGEGRVIEELIDWRQVGLSGESINIEDLAKVRLELRRSKDWLKLNYPKFKKQIEDSGAKWTEGKESSNSLSETKDNGGSKDKGRPIPYNDSDILKLVKTFVRDYSTIAISNEQTQEEIQEEKEYLSEGETPDVDKWQDHKAHIEAHLNDLNEIYQQFGLNYTDGEDALESAIDLLLQDNPEADLNIYLLQAKVLKSHIESHEILMEENPNGEKLKYKKALRCIESLGDLVLYDGESKDDHSTIPLVAYYSDRIDSPWGFGMVRPILDSQKMAAEMQWKEMIGLRKVANPAIIIEGKTGLEKEDVTNEDGAKYFIENGNIRYLEPGRVSPQINQFIQDRKQNIRDISGINEVTQGNTMHPNQSGFSIQKLQQQAQSRIRMKERNIDRHSTKRLVYLLASLAIQYYPVDKWLDINEKEFREENIIFNPIDLEDLDYQVEIKESSLIGVDKSALTALYFQFVQAGGLTFDEFIELAPGLPNKEKIKEMIKTRNNKDEMINQLQEELLALKGNFAPETLNEDELKQFQQIQQSGINNG